MREQTVEKLCPQCGDVMWVVDVAPFGRMWLCAVCTLSMVGERLYKWSQQVEEPPAPIEVRKMDVTKHKSTKPCPECRRPMWAIVEKEYGTRHQCEHCRLTVMFGGGISRWRNLAKTEAPNDATKTAVPPKKPADADAET